MANLYGLNVEHCPSRCTFSLIELLALAVCPLLGIMDVLLWTEFGGDPYGGPPGLLGTPLCEDLLYTEGCDLSCVPLVLLEIDLVDSFVPLECVLIWSGSFFCLNWGALFILKYSPSQFMCGLSEWYDFLECSDPNWGGGSLPFAK